MRPHLEDDGVEIVFVKQVEEGYSFALLLFYGKARLAGPVYVGDGCHPGSAELALGGRGAA